MKKNIHPAYADISVTCSCGNTFAVGSTLGKELRIELCPKCHPVFTKKGNLKTETGGKVDRFKQKYGNMLIQAKPAAAASESPESK